MNFSLLSQRWFSLLSQIWNIVNFSPLSQRWTTALILLPPMVGGILYLPNHALGILLAAFILAGAWEWALLSALPRYSYIIFLTAALILTWELIRDSSFLTWLLFLSAGMWLLYGLLIIGRYPLLPWWWRWRFMQAIIGFGILIPPWAALVALQGGYLSLEINGAHATLFLFAVIWLADSAAFFAGQKWGQHRLAPRVSPAKTWEGLAGALVTTLGMTALGAWQLKIAPSQWLLFGALCVITLIASVIGDLFESVVKRTHDKKDSGRWLPGHGGVLDRIDSLTAAAPIFVGGLILMGRI